MNNKDILKRFLEFLGIQFIAYPVGGIISVNITGDNATMWSTWIAGSFAFAVLMTIYFIARENNCKTIVLIMLGVFMAGVLAMTFPLSLL